MNIEAKKLLYRMVVATMAGKTKTTWALYEQYQKESCLHVPVKEIMEWKRRTAC